MNLLQGETYEMQPYQQVPYGQTDTSNRVTKKRMKRYNLFTEAKVNTSVHIKILLLLQIYNFNQQFLRNFRQSVDGQKVLDECISLALRLIMALFDMLLIC